MFQLIAEMGLRLLVSAAPSLPPPITRSDQTARNLRRLESKSNGRGTTKRG